MGIFSIFPSSAKYRYYSLSVPGQASLTGFANLEIPVLLKGTFGGFFIGAGPDFIIPVSKMKTTHPAAGYSESDADFAVGITPGLGYAYNL